MGFRSQAFPQSTFCSRYSILCQIQILFISLFFPILCVADPQLRVACNLPLTGNLAVYGKAVQEGVQFYREKNVTQADPVIWDWADNEGNGKKTVLNLRLQLESKPDIYVSGVKPQYMIIEDALKRASIPNFAWVFDSYLRAKNLHNFRIWVNFREEAEVFLRLQESKKAKRVAILYVMTPSVEEQQRKIIIPELNKRGLKDVLVIPYQIDNLDFNSIALKIKQFSPDLLFLSGFQRLIRPRRYELRF
jgi:ABC-type branched-subunit amino acid transport system substrate-binding protein